MMKRVVTLTVVALVLAWVTAAAEAPVVIQTVYTGVSHVYSPDGTHLVSIPWPVVQGELRITGEVTHYMDLAGDGHIINDGQGREKGQEFQLDPFYGIFLDRTRITGTMELILFDECTGTMSGTCENIHEVFGTAEEVLPYYPWAEPVGSVNGRGWWFIGTEVQVFIPVPEM